MEWKKVTGEATNMLDALLAGLSLTGSVPGSLVWNVTVIRVAMKSNEII